MSFIDKAKKAAYEVATSVGSQMIKPPTTSCFNEKGFLIPEEFVAAGDALVHKCHTWQWASGDKSLLNPALPADKQFLITRRVPCRRRARGLANSLSEHELEDGWIETTDSHAGDTSLDAADIATLSIGDEGGAAAGGGAAKGPVPSAEALLEEEFDEDDVPEMDDVDDDEAIEDADPAAVSAAMTHATNVDGGDDILHTRTYDVSITYDNYHWTPRVWLFGYDEQNRPLRPQQMLEDMSQDHAEKTVTIDPHPHVKDIPHLSIHPCRHAEVMKKLTDMTRASGREIRPDQSLFLFLKFVSSAIPTIEYDYTMDVDV